ESPAEIAFRERVAPVLERRCLSCHNDADRKGGLSLTSREQLQRGGDSGAVIDADPPRSPLLIAIRGESPEMPKTGPKLKPAEVAAITEWLAAGAPWPERLVLSERPIADLDWWSLRPLVGVHALACLDRWEERHAEAWTPTKNPIDAFIFARLQQEGFT